MVISLAARQRWALAGFAAAALLYAGIAARQFAASYFGQHASLPHLQRAIRLAPGNADYRYRLGRFFAFDAGNPQAALEHYSAAVRLNPYEARFWFDFASVQRILGNTSAEHDALERAVRAEPTDPQVAWEAANFFLAQGETDRALREFRVVLENDPSLSNYALRSCWRVRPDADALLRDVIPHRADTLVAFAAFLRWKRETEAAIKAWDQLAQLHQKFDSTPLFDQIRYLVEVRRPDAAMHAWEQSAATLELTAYLPTPDNLIVNGDFSLDILNGGFDWNYQVQPGVRLQLDASDFREGERSLFINFEGPGIATAGIRQWIPVHGETAYEFAVYHKSSEFQGAGGPQIVLRDAYSGQPLFTSDPLNGADFWKVVHGRFTTPASTTLLVLNVERIPAGSPMRGQLWLDDFQLSSASDKERP